MNKEEILNKYIDLIDKGYCSDCNELNCIDNFPHAKITHAIRELQQENQQLKEEKERLKNCYSSITIVGRQKGRAYEEAKRYISVCDSLGLKDIKITLVDSEDKKRIEKAIEVLKLCNSQCAKETISILKGEENVKEDKTTI